MNRAEFDPERLKRLRARLNLSQQGLAERLGVSMGSVHRWETGKKVPLRGFLKQIEALEREVGLGEAKAA